MAGLCRGGFGRLLAYRTTGKRLAFLLVSRPYRIGYNVLAVRLVIAYHRLNSSSPLSRGQAFRFGLSDIQLLRCFEFYSFIIEQKERKCITERTYIFIIGSGQKAYRAEVWFNGERGVC